MIGPSDRPGDAAHSRPRVLPLMVIGVAAGLLSGLFGVGGGTLIVPGLVLWLGMSQRLAAGTSVAAILPTAMVGAVTYGLQANVDWVAAVCLAVGIIAGAQLGSYLLARLKISVLQWSFMVFLAVIVVSLWFVVPHRDAQIEMGIVVVVLLVLTGFVTGILSGLLGVGGGVVVVPVLMFFFGANDLVAKGTSLVMMIPGSVSGTLGNARRHNVDLRSALFIGITASVCVPFGALIAARVDPFVGNVAFSIYLAVLLAQLLWRQLRGKRFRR